VPQGAKGVVAPEPEQAESPWWGSDLVRPAPARACSPQLRERGRVPPQGALGGGACATSRLRCDPWSRQRKSGSTVFLGRSAVERRREVGFGSRPHRVPPGRLRIPAWRSRSRAHLRGVPRTCRSSSEGPLPCLPTAKLSLPACRLRHRRGFSGQGSAVKTRRTPLGRWGQTSGGAGSVPSHDV